jgi:hypothetical protein
VSKLSQPPYPELSFTFDTQAATFVKRHDDLLAKFFTLWAVYVFILILLALAFYGFFRLLGHPWLAWVVITLGLSMGPFGPVLLVVLFVVGQLQLPRVRCSDCGERMKRKWLAADAIETKKYLYLFGKRYLFLICPRCRKYVNTRRTGL